MNNFIFAYIKEKESVEISLSSTSLDMVFGAVLGDHFQKIKDVLLGWHIDIGRWLIQDQNLR